MKEVIIKLDKNIVMFRDNKTIYFGFNSMIFYDLFIENNISSNEDRIKFLKKTFNNLIIIEK